MERRGASRIATGLGEHRWILKSSISESTLNNQDVEECINAVIQTLEFDATDGGVCVIHYPFVFDIEE